MAVQIVKHQHYRIEITTAMSPKHPIVYFRKVGKCTTLSGEERQYDRLTNEAYEAWRAYNVKRITVAPIPYQEVK
mgnify:CR=1 FL=1